MAMEYQQKLEAIMEHIQETGLWTNTFSDVIIGSYKTLPADAGNHISIDLPEEQHYNTIPLFTMLTALQRPHGSMLIQGAPGIGKTTIAEYISHFIFDIPTDHIYDSTIYCHPELTQEQMIARLCTASLLKEGVEKIIERSFIPCPIHMLDEINRLPPDKTSIFYQAVDRGFVKYMDHRLILEPGPIFGTANYNDGGNFDMTPPFLDRFEVSVGVPSPNAIDLEFITDADDEDVKRLIVKDEFKLTKKDRDNIWEQMKAMKFSKEARNYIHYFASQVNFCMRAASPKYSPCAPAFMNKGSCETQKPDRICHDCHYHNDSSVCNKTENELSVRGVKAIYKYSKALGWFLGQDEVTIETVKNVLPYVARHRLKATPSADNQCTTTAKLPKTALVNMLIEKAEDSFNRATPIFESYGSIINAFEKVEKGEMKPAELKKVEEHGQEEISQHDDPVKFALACWMQRLHHYIKSKYKI
ncbi:MAG: MoxR family ATPase [Nanoarchaeota archaeon]|nr:MoxR family ATPase [Nanoarchaeota archaeon]